VRANCVCPGRVDTDLVPNSQALYGADVSDRTTGGFTRVVAPIQRAAAPREIATVVSFLLSNDAAFMTGAAVSVDGGYTAI
jgi:NAD(P)-dependent dehydrogenase (short-subunit alcohol dehydrogenase family)